ncbi:hypothetical protein [Sphingomonas sp. URHD0057]|uniref:hypothetical protein n=1 Tax=Sphingomonas sp. URHD0057 TaxID=1380389 RepID=UPI0004902845|nr:hypothetical protein [Sphingomonas sp. URHD0057]
MKTEPEQPSAPNMRTFSLNSREFAEAVRERGTRAWIPNGALPREPRSRRPEVIVEPRIGGSR